MSETKIKMTRWLHLRLSEAEFNKIKKCFSQSTKRKMSEYARAVLLAQPITVYTRNQSFDDFVAEMVLLRRELKALGNNFNQSVKKLHSINRDPEIKSWAIRNEDDKKSFFNKVDEINAAIIQIADKWLPE